MDIFFETVSFMPFFMGSVLCLTAVVMLVFPPKRINSFYGYRTPTSQSSPERWKFAQTYAARLMFFVGLVCVAVSMYTQFFDVSESFESTAGYIIMAVAIIFLFFKTESAIKSKFPNT